MHVCVVNNSTRVTEADAAAMTAAVEIQAVRDFWPAWGIRVPRVTYGETPGAAVIAVVDTIPGAPAGVLGYHTETGSVISGFVAASPPLDAGGQVLTGDWSVASVLSHEVLEALGDPRINLWGDDGQGRLWAYEACDAVEGPSYPVTLPSGQSVSVSNFLLPAWFDPQAAGKVDHLGLAGAPFTILPTGYAVYLAGGQEQQVSGSEFPDWRKAMKGPASRTGRRQSAFPG